MVLDALVETYNRMNHLPGDGPQGLNVPAIYDHDEILARPYYYEWLSNEIAKFMRVPGTSDDVRKLLSPLKQDADEIHRIGMEAMARGVHPESPIQERQPATHAMEVLISRIDYYIREVESGDVP